MIHFWTTISRIEKLQDYCYKIHMDILTIKESKNFHDTIILVPGEDKPITKSKSKFIEGHDTLSKEFIEGLREAYQTELNRDCVPGPGTGGTGK
jgi:hypothetical protein